MNSSERSEDRRVAGRVEAILPGWWKLGEGKFQRCKTLDVSVEGALVVLDSVVPEGTQFALHLDVEADWSMPLLAEVLWQRPIFFGKQQLTSVKYRFKKPEDHSMFGLWIQRRLQENKGPRKEHTKPVVLSTAPKQELQPSIERAPQISRVESKWKQRLSHLTAKIPWIETDELPSERRMEARGQVGLRVNLEWEGESYSAEFLNVSLSGAGLFLPQLEPSGQKKLALTKGIVLDICLPESQFLLGASRCPAEIVWCFRAKQEGVDENRSGYVVGMRFASKPSVTRRSFVGDLLKRINYNVRQVRSELRFPREVPALVHLPGGERVEGKTLDISAGGASILLPADIKTPCDVALELRLSEERGKVRQVSLSSRLLRSTVDNQGRTCYAVAFRKGQGGEHLELSRWLASLLPVQGLRELIPNFSKSRMGELE